MSDADDRTEARIWGYSDQRDRINNRKRGNETQADVLDRLLDTDDGAGADGAGGDGQSDTAAPDPDDLAAAVAGEIDSADVDAATVADELAARLSVPSADDVRNAAERGAQQAIENMGR